MYACRVKGARVEGRPDIVLLMIMVCSGEMVTIFKPYVNMSSG